MGMKKSVSRLEPLTRVSQPAAPRVQENYYTVNVPDSALEASEDVVRYNAEDIAIHNLSSDQNIAIQPADSIPSTAPSQPAAAQPACPACPWWWERYPCLLPDTCWLLIASCRVMFGG